MPWSKFSHFETGEIFRSVKTSQFQDITVYRLINCPLQLVTWYKTGAMLEVWETDLSVLPKMWFDLKFSPCYWTSNQFSPYIKSSRDHKFIMSGINKFVKLQRMSQIWQGLAEVKTAFFPCMKIKLSGKRNEKWLEEMKRFLLIVWTDRKKVCLKDISCDTFSTFWLVWSLYSELKDIRESSYNSLFDTNPVFRFYVR